ncbi:cysteine desulfurase family protein [Feifania hominis]|uniref:Cysteine desulfurase n=1 Tax=Feifania hominis TaxID=2763660 RepID=A0A926HVJ1_9FIRM|nr:cysteine desulfurase family protein [Feifania hominis]MBC8536676.1 cysteine desulfurase [Feifania hominis]
MEHYLDNSATTKPYPQAVWAMTEVLTRDYGNPSSAHRKGVESEAHLRAARETVAKTLACEADELFFTSGGTEADNLAILGGAAARSRAGRHIVTTDSEHPAVENAVGRLEERGFTVTRLSTRGGMIDPAALEAALRPDTALVSMMMVNNETGAVYPVNRVRELLEQRSPNALFHIDAVQGYGKLPFSVKKLGCDLLTVSAHKIGGPKGVGALYVRRGVHIESLVCGGGQEGNLRSGTENLPGIAGFAAACEATFDDLPRKLQALRALREELICRLGEQLPQAIVHLPAQAAPHIVNFSLPPYKSETLVHALEQYDVFVSGGSACNAKKKVRSRALTAFGLPDEQVDSALRVSFCFENTREDIDALLDALGAAAASLAAGTV